MKGFFLKGIVHGSVATLDDVSGFSDLDLAFVVRLSALKGECDWNEWLQLGKIEGADTNYGRFFFDILNNKFLTNFIK